MAPDLFKSADTAKHWLERHGGANGAKRYIELNIGNGPITPTAVEYRRRGSTRVSRALVFEADSDTISKRLTAAVGALAPRGSCRSPSSRTDVGSTFTDVGGTFSVPVEHLTDQAFEIASARAAASDDPPDTATCAAVREELHRQFPDDAPGELDGDRRVVEAERLFMAASPRDPDPPDQPLEWWKIPTKWVETDPIFFVSGDDDGRVQIAVTKPQLSAVPVAHLM